MPPADAWIVLALGSNVGDREALLAFARDRLPAAGVPWELASTIHETAPVGGPPGQDPYLNQVLAARRAAVPFGPRVLLEVALAIEREAGRERRERWGPRTLDVDIVLYGDMVVREPGLTIPHPRLAERAFVLEPLAEILPGLVHPEFGRTIADLAAALRRG